MLIIEGAIGTDEEGAKKFLGLSDRPNLFLELRAAGYFASARKGWYLYESLAEGARRLASERTSSDTIKLDVQPGGKATTTKRRGPHGPGEHPVYKTPT